MQHSFVRFCGAMALAAGFAQMGTAAQANAAHQVNSSAKRAPTAMVETAMNTATPRSGDTLGTVRPQTELVPVDSLTYPPADIAFANVRGDDGRIVGAVQRVDLAPNGAPKRVAASFLRDQNKLVILDPHLLRYDAVHNEIRIARQAAARK
ncbi:MAG: hypothetical protein H6924_06200 [Alphaproteobacteria bacterium]|nr:hypothetical protein [Alphaproteobacteria bacterium]